MYLHDCPLLGTNININKNNDQSSLGECNNFISMKRINITFIWYIKQLKNEVLVNKNWLIFDTSNNVSILPHFLCLKKIVNQFDTKIRPMHSKKSYTPCILGPSKLEGSNSNPLENLLNLLLINYICNLVVW